ncbi:hypothetical protein GCM10008906_12430 [Clostridium oceanicum]|uniref:Uncharacterized protein n=1 Tax=Clostridium oceanicum TaxID=1543 RepID=A0ABP3UNB0_9CLOT
MLFNAKKVLKFYCKRGTVLVKEETNLNKNINVKFYLRDSLRIFNNLFLNNALPMYCAKYNKNKYCIIDLWVKF